MTTKYASEQFRLTKQMKVLFDLCGVRCKKIFGRVRIEDSYSIGQTELHPQGGTWTDVTVISREGGTIKVLTESEVRATSGSLFNPSCENFVSALPPHVMVVETGFFCGKESMPTFHVGPESLWLDLFGTAVPESFRKRAPAEVLQALSGRPVLSLPA